MGIILAFLNLKKNTSPAVFFFIAVTMKQQKNIEKPRNVLQGLLALKTFSVFRVLPFGFFSFFDTHCWINGQNAAAAMCPPNSGTNTIISELCWDCVLSQIIISMFSANTHTYETRQRKTIIAATNSFIIFSFRLNPSCWITSFLFLQIEPLIITQKTVETQGMSWV